MKKPHPRRKARAYLDRITEKEKKAILRRFMKEMFPIKELFKVGFFTPEMKGDYQAMADRICGRLGYETVFEYRAQAVSAHLTMVDRPKDEPFVTVFTGIYE